MKNTMCGHGGARKGAGRKKKRRSLADRRMPLSTMVSQATDYRIRALAKRMGVSIGRALDATFNKPI